MIRTLPSNTLEQSLTRNALYFQRTSSWNLWLAMASVIIIGINGVCIVFNAMLKEGSACGEPNDTSKAQCGSPTSVLTFHLTEFWATFVFAIVQSLSISYSVLPTPFCPNQCRFRSLKDKCTFKNIALT